MGHHRLIMFYISNLLKLIHSARPTNSDTVEMGMYMKRYLEDTAGSRHLANILNNGNIKKIFKQTPKGILAKDCV